MAPVRSDGSSSRWDGLLDVRRKGSRRPKQRVIVPLDFVLIANVDQ